MGLAKSAPKPESVQNPQAVKDEKTLATGFNSYTYDNVPLDIYNIFSLEIVNTSSKERAKLRDIYDWSKEGSQTLGDAMLKISKLQSQLGESGFERRHDKIWNWVTLQRKINDIRKSQQARVKDIRKRQKAMEKKI